jgi:hypothetical protein
MKTDNFTPTEKRKYSAPEINTIKIDKEISLVMMSSNPGGDPDESLQQDHFNLNPFKIFTF